MAQDSTFDAERLRAYCAQAQRAWAVAESLQVECEAEQALLGKLRSNALWLADAADREALAHRASALETRLRPRLAALREARRAALAASERAAHYGWGVRLGRSYWVTHKGETSDFVLQMLRPFDGDAGASRMLASGLTDGRPILFVLGRDALTLVPTNSNVFDMTARLWAANGVRR